jgi:hypothetical protein
MNFITRQVMALLLSAVAVLFVGVVGAKAEIHDNSIGLRLSEGTLFGVELDYQKKVSEINRLELGLSYGYEGERYLSISYGISWVGAVGFFQWHWDIKEAKGVSWYVGPGVDLGFWTFSYDLGLPSYYYSSSRYSDSRFYMYLGGEIGIEYDLNVSKSPVLLSLDVRPMLGILHSHDGSCSVGLSVRYTF